MTGGGGIRLGFWQKGRKVFRRGVSRSRIRREAEGKQGEEEAWVDRREGWGGGECW